MAAGSRPSPRPPSRNGASAHAPGDTFRWPHTVNPNRPPGWRTRWISATASVLCPRSRESWWRPGTSRHPTERRACHLLGHRTPDCGSGRPRTNLADASIPAHSAPVEPCQLDRESRTTRHVNQPVAGADLESVMYKHVLAAVVRLAECRESTALRPHPSSTIFHCGVPASDVGHHRSRADEVVGRTGRLELMTPVSKPARCKPPAKRACSILMQRFITTESPASWASSAASSLQSPSWAQNVPGSDRDGIGRDARSSSTRRKASTMSGASGRSGERSDRPDGRGSTTPSD